MTKKNLTVKFRLRWHCWENITKQTSLPLSRTYHQWTTIIYFSNDH